MEIEHSQSELTASAHLVKESRAGLFELFGIRASEIDKETVVRKNHIRPESAFLTITSESLRLLIADGFRHPTRRIASEQRKRLRADGSRIKRRIAHPIHYRNMCSYKFHLRISFDAKVRKNH
jgi:hypothetical protein